MYSSHLVLQLFLIIFSIIAIVLVALITVDIFLFVINKGMMRDAGIIYELF